MSTFAFQTKTGLWNGKYAESLFENMMNAYYLTSLMHSSVELTIEKNDYSDGLFKFSFGGKTCNIFKEDKKDAALTKHNCARILAQCLYPYMKFRITGKGDDCKGCIIESPRFVALYSVDTLCDKLLSYYKEFILVEKRSASHVNDKGSIGKEIIKQIEDSNINWLIEPRVLEGFDIKQLLDKIIETWILQ